MKCRLTARAALAFGLRSLARDAIRFGRARSALLDRTARDASRGRCGSVALYAFLLIVGL